MAKLERTTTPGVYRRHVTECDGGRCECPYVAIWRHNGTQRKRTFQTLAEAREGLATGRRAAKLSKGHAAGLHHDEPRAGCPDCKHEMEQREEQAPTLHLYAREWIERYQGTGRRGFREETRDDYRWNLERYALRHFPEELKLGELTPRMVADFIAWVTRQPRHRGEVRLAKELGRDPTAEELVARFGTLSDSSVRNALKPLSAALATARREGLIPHNPANGAVLPHRPAADDDAERVRPFPGETMELVVALVHPDHRLMFELLAATGVRRSELLALQGRHLHLSGDRPFVKVRQRVRRRKGQGLLMGPLKSRHARRDLPIPVGLADRFLALQTPEDGLVFSTGTGTMLDPDNLHDRVLSPAAAEAGVEWAGFHTFRHTVASRLFAAGRNAVQVQRWLGHHSPSFTLDTYVHLLDGDLGEPLTLRGNKKATERPEMAANQTEVASTENGSFAGKALISG